MWTLWGMDIHSVGKQHSLNSSADRGTSPSPCLESSVLAFQSLIKQGTALRNVTCCCANPWVTQQCNARACSVMTDCSVFLSTLFFFLFMFSLVLILSSFSSQIHHLLLKKQKRGALRSTNHVCWACLLADSWFGTLDCIFQACDFTVCQDLMSIFLFCKPLVDS